MRKEYAPTFNIHIKTKINGGEFGYPDDGYFARCLDELNSNGVGVKDLKWTRSLPDDIGVLKAMIRRQWVEKFTTELAEKGYDLSQFDN